MMIRLGLCMLAALALGGTKASPPGGSPLPPDTSNASVRARVNWRVISFKGSTIPAPPGVVPLGANVFLFGATEVEVPQDVILEFNDRGEAVFTLDPSATPHSFVVRVGSSKLIAGARSRLVVPPPSVGRPRFDSIPFAYRVPTPREFLDQAYDLGDPLDASPFR